jgi:pimeloyl-ACP methyl ester carboxylesterase
MVCDAAGIEVYYETAGEGRPVLMIHGFSPDHRLMEGCMEPIFRGLSGYKRIYFDLPGMGRTRGAEWIDCSDRMLTVVMDFIRQTIPEGDFLLAGQSYGGYLARGLVRSMPECIGGLLLLCPVIFAQSEKRDVPPHTVLKQDESLLSRLSSVERQNMINDLIVQSAGVYERYKNEVHSGIQVADNAFLFTFKKHGYPFSFDVDSLEKPFDKPALFLLGRQDSVVGYRDAWRILESYPRAAFAVLDSAGHNLQIEQDRLFAGLVTEWLERIESYNSL